MTSHERHIRLDGAHNVRDLGGYATASGGMVPWRTFLRADALHELSPADIEALLALGLSTVIDLRSDAELAQQPSTFAAREGVRYHHISLFDGLAPADAMLASSESFDLGVRYIAAIDTCRPALLKVAEAIAEADDGVVLFNCTAGKDRTGIVAALLLSLAGVSAEDIAEDYGLTATIGAVLITKLRARVLSRGLDEAQTSILLSSEPAAMRAFLRHVEQKHGGFRRYLLGTDVESPSVLAIEKRLFAAQPG